MDQLKSTWATLPIVKVVQKSSEIFAVTAPNLYDYKGTSLLYVSYGIVSCLSHLISLGLVMNVFWKNGARALPMTSNVLFTILRFQLAFANVTIVVSQVLLKRRRLVGFTKKFGNVERALQRNFQRNIDNKPTVLTAQLGVFIGLLTCIGIIDVCATTPVYNYDALLTVTHCLYRLENVAVALTTAQVRCWCARIQSAVRFLNERMRETLGVEKDEGVVFEVTSRVKPDATFFLRRYDELCDAVDAVSDVYGAAMLMIVGCAVANLLAASNSVMKVLTLLSKGSVTYNSLLLSSLLSIIEYAIVSVMLAVPCGNAANEARKTSMVSYKILLRFQGSSSFGRYKNVKEELLLLAEQARARNVRFSTGFFPVDYNVLFLILGSVATYLIIILQFQ